MAVANSRSPMPTSPSALKLAADRHLRPPPAPSSMDSKYWLPPKQPIELPAATECLLLDRIEDTVSFVLDCLGPNAAVVTNWKVKARRNGMSFYEDHTLQQTKQADNQEKRYCCVAQSIATVEDIMELFVATDNETVRKNARIMHNKVIDTRLISMIKTPTAENPYASTYVKYTRVSSGMWHRDRDMCAVVATDFVEMSDGSTMGYCLWDSVELDECPDLTMSQGVQRTRMVRSGYIIRNSGQPHASTRIIYFCGLDAETETRQAEASATQSYLRRLSLSQQLTPAATFHALDQIGGNLEKICSHFRRKPLDVHQFAKRSDWTSLSQARYCCSCHHTFSLLSRRYNCTACGEVMCRTCSQKETVDLPGVGLKAMKICAFCVRGMDETFRMSRTSQDGHRSTSRSTAVHNVRINDSFLRRSPVFSADTSEESDIRDLRGTTSRLARW